MTATLYARARRIRERLLVRAWEYRQRAHAKGVWYRLRRLLVDAAEAWEIDESEAAALESAGRTPHPVGQELIPAKRIFLVDENELQSIKGRRRIAVRLTAEFLRARNLALVPFPAPQVR